MNALVVSIIELRAISPGRFAVKNGLDTVIARPYLVCVTSVGEDSVVVA